MPQNQRTKKLLAHGLSVILIFGSILSPSLAGSAEIVSVPNFAVESSDPESTAPGSLETRPDSASGDKAFPAAIPAVIAALRVAFVAWQRSRAAQQVMRLREVCTRAYQAYKRIGFATCTDRCGGQWDRDKRDSCYKILIPEIEQTIDLITGEIDGREAVLEMCAKNGVGLREDGSPMQADAGHAQEIVEKRNARDRCRSIASRRAGERGRGKSFPNGNSGGESSPNGVTQ